VLSVALST
jgi:hypothetical protein